MPGKHSYRSWLLCQLLMTATAVVAAEEAMPHPGFNEHGAALVPLAPPSPGAPPIAEAAGSSSDPGTADEAADPISAAIRQRALARWETMIDRDFHRAYGFCSPAYRALFTARQFAARYGSPQLVWERAEVLSVRKSGDDAAKVEIRLSAKAFVTDAELAIPVSTVFTENWVQAEDAWWFSPAK